MSTLIRRKYGTCQKGLISKNQFLFFLSVNIFLKDYSIAIF